MEQIKYDMTEEEEMLSILIDESIQSESLAESHCSQKRKAADLEYENNLKEKRSLKRVFYVLYILSVTDISYKMRTCLYVQGLNRIMETLQTLHIPLLI
jgi:hypothetical protein